MTQSGLLLSAGTALTTLSAAGPVKVRQDVLLGSALAEEVRACRACGKTKPVSAFYTRPKKTGDGYVTACKECSCAYNRKWQREHGDKARKNANLKKWVRSHPSKALLSAAKQRASRKGISFTITEADIVIPALCPVLGIAISMGDMADRESSPSLDRIDNTLGYIPGNVVVTSFRANRLKSDATPDELLKIALFYRPPS